MFVFIKSFGNLLKSSVSEPLLPSVPQTSWIDIFLPVCAVQLKVEE